MKKNIHSLLILILGITLLSGCSTGISNEQLKRDIKALPSLAGIVQVNEISILEKKETQGQLDYKLSVLLSSYELTTTADITLTYTKTDGKYTLSHNTVDIVKATPNHSAQVNPYYYEAIRAISEHLFYKDNQSGNQNSSKSTLSLVSAHLTSDTLSGSGTVVIGESYSDDVFTANALYTIQATYNIVYGWTYELKDWEYHDTTKWSGVYDIHWTKEVPGYPANGLNSFYKLGQDLTGIQITGECSVTRRMSQPDNDLVENTITISFDYAGVHLENQPEIAGFTNELIFRMAINPDMLMIFQYAPYYNVNDLNEPGNKFYVGVPCLEGVITKRSN